jgi:hypothetical protein
MSSMGQALGRSPKLRVGYMEKSAEVIVPTGNELRKYLRWSHK